MARDKTEQEQETLKKYQDSIDEILKNVFTNVLQYINTHGTIVFNQVGYIDSLPVSQLRKYSEDIAYRKNVSDQFVQHLQNEHFYHLPMLLENENNEETLSIVEDAYTLLWEILFLKEIYTYGLPQDIYDQSLQSFHANQHLASLKRKIDRTISNRHELFLHIKHLDRLDALLNTGSEIIKSILRNLDYDLKLFALMAPLKKNAKTTWEGDKTQRRKVEGFRFSAPKLYGREAGAVTVKRVRSNDNDKAASQKYQNQWLIKHEQPDECVRAVLTSSIFKFLLGDDAAPKMRLILSKAGTLHVASKMYQNYNDIIQFADPSIENKFYISDHLMNEAFAPGITGLIAVSVLVGNYDIHMANIGLANYQSENKRAVAVDLSRSLYLKRNCEIFTSGNLGPNVILESGEYFTPSDMVRTWCGSVFNLNRSVFLNEYFAAALYGVVTTLDERKSEFLDYLTEEIRIMELTLEHSPEKEAIMRSLEKTIGKNIAELGLARAIHDVLTERLPSVATLSQHVTLQNIIHNNKMTDFDEWIKRDPKILERIIPWISNSWTQYPSNILDYYKANRYLLSPDIEKIIRSHQEKPIHPLRKAMDEHNLDANARDLWVKRSTNKRSREQEK